MRERLERAALRLRRQDLAGAEREVLDMLRRAPNDPDALNLLGLVRLERRDYPGALAALSAAIRLRAPFPEALINLATVCNRTGEHELACRLSELACEAQPDSPLPLINLGMAWKGLRRLEDAKRAFARAGAHPMARFNLGHVLLLENDLAAGLPLCEERRAVLRTGDRLRGEAWTGDARPDATLLVVPEQGLGDFLLMSRFFAALPQRFKRVIVHTPGPLARLVATLDPRLEVVTSLTGLAWDYWAPIMSLPWLLGVRALAEVPTAPWIDVPAVATERPRPRIGLNWAGNPAYAYDTVRSAPLATFAPLLSIGGVDWVSLHRGTREHEAAEHGLEQPLLGARDFLDTAGVLRKLDLVLSTETAIPNLSAAMGVPTCVLSVRDVDWRWAGWYRGVTICDQDEPGQWAGAIIKAARAIERQFFTAAAPKAA